jgi:tRNA threonylcarbamoyladenosine biosynthesis protein TsaB
MFVLGVDTATDYAVVGVTDDGQVVREVSRGPGPDRRPRHSEVLLPEIERSVEAAGGWSRIERIAVGIGPGSFTGLRIGISTARALAHGHDLPLAPVESLAALARGISKRTESEFILPVFDARRGEAFASLFAHDGEELWPATVLPPAVLAQRVRELGSPPLAAGDGALRFGQELEAAGATVAPPEDPIHRVAARHVCAVGEAAVEAPGDQVQPLYLRPPDAKRWRERDRGGPGR